MYTVELEGMGYFTKSVQHGGGVRKVNVTMIKAEIILKSKGKGRQPKMLLVT